MKPLTYLSQARLVLLLAALFGATLALVQAGLTPQIEANKQEETRRQIPALVPGAHHAAPARWDQRPVLEARNEQDALCGWVVPARGPGFAGPIEILVGLDRDAATITGVYVLSQVETPGLGNRIAEADWLDQFRGRSTAAPLSLAQVDGISGATISSESVMAIVNDVMREPRTGGEK